MAQKAKSGGSLEREVIVAVVILYLVLSAVMLVIHYALPDQQQPTATSSTSPSHKAHRAPDAAQ